MLSFITRAAAKHPRKLAFIDGKGRGYDYDSLLGLARALSGRLAALDLERGARVAVLAQNRIETIALLFACSARGLVLVPLNYRLALAELETIVDDCDPDVLFCDETFRGTASELVPSARLLAIEEFAHQGDPRDIQETQADPESIAMVLYTSGTTGLPKGVMLSTRMLLANAEQTRRAWRLTEADSTVTSAPLFHTGGWNVLTLPLLLAGGTVTLLEKFEPYEVAELFAQGRASVLFGVPTMYQLLLETSETKIAGAAGAARFFISGGAPCPHPLIRQYLAMGINFRQGFGMTEAGPNCFQFPASAVESKLGSVGKPVTGTRMKLVDEKGKSARSGELMIGGPHLFSGYWKKPLETEKTFVDGWVRTGDLAERDEDGFYRILGRKKDMYISGGENVYPAEVEQVLALHPRVAEVAVVGVPDPKWQEVGKAFVVAKDGGPLNATDLLEFCSRRLARFKQPKSFEFVAALPKNSVGKIQKASLRNGNN